MAHIDALFGNDVIMSSGNHQQFESRYRQLLADRYGVEVSGYCCNVSEDGIAFVEAYNAVAGPRLRNKFGKDFREECFADARAEYEITHRRRDD